MPKLTFTPKQRLNLRASIEEHGLNEELFQIDITSEHICLTHYKSKYYFLFSVYPPHPVSIAHLISEKLLDFHIKFTPSKSNPHFGADKFSRYGAESWEKAVSLHLNGWLFWLKEHYGPFEMPRLPATNRLNKKTTPSLAHLHPTVQKAASTRFASKQYSDAVEKACVALEKAVRDKANQPSDLGGTDLMNRVFSQANPMITLSPKQGEREGYMFLFRGMWQALRNHYAHNETTIPMARALEWLSFISALFYKLDEAQPTAPTP